MTTLKQTILIMGIMALFVVVFFQMDVNTHEEVHWRIFQQYNVESRIEWVMESRGDGFVFAQTVPTSPTNLTLEQWDDMNFLHGLNEIDNPLDYSGIIFKSLVLTFLAVIVMFPQGDKRNEEQ